jgi:Peroxisomal membrane protein (Pex16)
VKKPSQQSAHALTAGAALCSLLHSLQRCAPALHSHSSHSYRPTQQQQRSAAEAHWRQQQQQQQHFTSLNSAAVGQSDAPTAVTNGWLLTGELLHIVRPLLYSCACAKRGETSWSPWLLSLCLDALSRASSVKGDTAGGSSLLSKNRSRCLSPEEVSSWCNCHFVIITCVTLCTCYFAESAVCHIRVM